MAKGLFDCTGKVTLVTGGNGGIGLGFAMGVAKMGGDIAIWARNADKNEAAAAARLAILSLPHASLSPPLSLSPSPSPSPS